MSYKLWDYCTLKSLSAPSQVHMKRIATMSSAVESRHNSSGLSDLQLTHSLLFLYRRGKLAPRRDGTFFLHKYLPLFVKIPDNFDLLAHTCGLSTTAQPMSVRHLYLWTIQMMYLVPEMHAVYGVRCGGKCSSFHVEPYV